MRISSKRNYEGPFTIVINKCVEVSVDDYDEKFLEVISEETFSTSYTHVDKDPLKVSFCHLLDGKRNTVAYSALCRDVTMFQGDKLSIKWHRVISDTGCSL